MNVRFFIAGMATLLASTAFFATLVEDSEAGPAKGPLDFTVKDIDGNDVSLNRYRGNVVVIVNTASQCGYTPQYASLERLYETYRAKGLKVLAFPSNDFGAQEPGSNAEIKQFCSLNYKTTFDLFGKVATKGPAASPLYKFLTGKTTNPRFAGDIQWNFTKFVVDKKGNVIARFPSNIDPMSAEFVAAIDAALKGETPSREKTPKASDAVSPQS